MRDLFEVIQRRNAEIKELQAEVEKRGLVIEKLRDALLEITDKAPHSHWCAGWHGHPEWGDMFIQDCNCWKKEG